MKTLLVGLFTVILLVACSPVATNPLRDTGFLRPSSYSVDSDLLNQMTEELGTLDYHAVLVIKDGALVYENYFSRKDEEWGQGIGLVNFDESTLHDLRSATKSIISALIGIAIEDGSIPGLSTPVTELLNKETLSAYHPPPGYPPLLLSHLLSMSSGFEWNERMSYADPKNSESQRWESDEPAKFAPVPALTWPQSVNILLVKVASITASIVAKFRIPPPT